MEGQGGIAAIGSSGLRRVARRLGSTRIQATEPPFRLQRRRACGADVRPCGEVGLIVAVSGEARLRVRISIVWTDLLIGSNPVADWKVHCKPGGLKLRAPSHVWKLIPFRRLSCVC